MLATTLIESRPASLGLIKVTALEGRGTTAAGEIASALRLVPRAVAGSRGGKWPVANAGGTRICCCCCTAHPLAALYAACTLDIADSGTRRHSLSRSSMPNSSTKASSALTITRKRPAPSRSITFAGFQLTAGPSKSATSTSSSSPIVGALASSARR